MRFIKGASFWILLGVGILAGMAYLVDGGFAAYFAPVVLGACGILALIAGIRASIRGRKIERWVRNSRENMDTSKEQQARWAAAAKKQCAEVEAACTGKTDGKSNLMFQPEFEAEGLIGQMVSATDQAKRTLAELDAEIQWMKEEGIL